MYCASYWVSIWEVSWRTSFAFSIANSSSAYASLSEDVIRFEGGISYLDVDFAGLFDCFLLYECDHPLEFVGHLFIAEAMRIGHLEVVQSK